MSQRCCCGKYTVEEGDRATVINDIGHEPFGRRGAFCGPVWKQELRDVRAERDGLIDIVKSLLTYSWPEISRGPAKKDWIESMRAAQKAVGYMDCPKCKGAGKVEVLVLRPDGKKVLELLRKDLCTCCYGIGLVNPEDW